MLHSLGSIKNQLEQLLELRVWQFIVGVKVSCTVIQLHKDLSCTTEIKGKNY